MIEAINSDELKNHYFIFGLRNFIKKYPLVTLGEILDLFKKIIC